MGKNLISLGRYKNKLVSFDLKVALNKHMVILGKPGGGKSVQAQKIIGELNSAGITTVVLDLHSVFSTDQIFHAYREQFEANMHEIDAYHDGISCELFSPITHADGEQEKLIDTAGAIVDVLSRTKKLGVKQLATLRRTVNYVIENDLYDIKGFAAVDEVLADNCTSVAESVREKLYPLTAHNIFRPGEFFVQEGKINVIRLSKFDLETQATVAEVLLAFIWRLATTSMFKEKGLFIFVDEFHNLPSGKGCALEQILIEGRRFNVNLILATQQIMMNATSMVQRKLLQSELILLFQPNTAQIASIARIIDPLAPDDWSLILRTLRQGEFVALGALDVDGRPMRKPLKVSNRMLEEASRMDDSSEYSVNGTRIG